MKKTTVYENSPAYLQTLADIEDAVKAIFRPMKGKLVTTTSISDSLANIVANFSDVVEDQVGIDSVRICREVAHDLLDVASMKNYKKLKRKGSK